MPRLTKRVMRKRRVREWNSREVRIARTERDNRIAELYRKGYTAREIGPMREIGLAKQTVTRILHRDGIPMRKRGTRSLVTGKKGTRSKLREAEHDGFVRFPLVDAQKRGFDEVPAPFPSTTGPAPTHPGDMSPKSQIDFWIKNALDRLEYATLGVKRLAKLFNVPI